jgi:hypothetical protein
MQEVDILILVVDFLVEFQVITPVLFKVPEVVALGQQAMEGTDQMLIQALAELLEVVFLQTLALEVAVVAVVALALVELVVLVGPDKLQSFG